MSWAEVDYEAAWDRKCEEDELAEMEYAVEQQEKFDDMNDCYQLLKKEANKLGLNTPDHMQMMIEELKSELAELQDWLDACPYPKYRSDYEPEYYPEDVYGY